MRIFGLNITRSTSTDNRNSKINNQKSFSPEWAGWMAGGPDPAAPGTSLANAYEQVVWVYRAVNVLAEQVANIPFLFSNGERGREHLITSGPLHDFYARPHPGLNRFQYWELRVLWLLLRGECFRLPIFRDSAGTLRLKSGAPIAGSDFQSEFENQNSKILQPRAGAPSAASPLESKIKNQNAKISHILFLDPADLQHVVQDHRLIGWRYTNRAANAPIAPQVFLPEEIWFEKLPNPFHCWRGLPPLAVAELAARTDFAAAAYMRGLIENNAENGLIVRTDAQLSDEQREQMAAALRLRKHHAGSPDRPVVLWGATEIVQPHLSSADLQFLENRKFTRAEICAAFGVPEEILTSTDYAKYDVMQGARLNFIENRVAPLCARLEAEEQPLVQALDPRAVGWFDLESLPILQQARRNRLAAAKVGFDMGVPFNELNQVFDLGFAALPWGNSGYLSANLQKVGNLPPAPCSRNLQVAPASPTDFNVPGATFEVPRSQPTPPSPRRDLPELLAAARQYLKPQSPKRDLPDLINTALNLLNFPPRTPGPEPAPSAEFNVQGSAPEFQSSPPVTPNAHNHTP